MFLHINCKYIMYEFVRFRHVGKQLYLSLTESLFPLVYSLEAEK